MCSMMIEEDWGDYGHHDDASASPPSPPEKTEEEKQAERRQAIHERFQKAIQEKDLEKLKASIAEGADIDAQIMIKEQERRRSYSAFDDFPRYEYHTVEHECPNALLYVTSEGKLDLARELVNSGAGVNQEKGGKTCLYSAVARANREWVDLILGSETFDWDVEGNRKTLKLAENQKDEGQAGKLMYHYLKHRYWQHDGPWKNASEQTISHVEYDEDGMIEITDRFNFASEERIRYMRDYTMNAVTSETLAFTDMSAKVQERVHEAWKALQKHNGTNHAATYKISRQRRYNHRGTTHG